MLCGGRIADKSTCQRRDRRLESAHARERAPSVGPESARGGVASARACGARRAGGRRERTRRAIHRRLRRGVRQAVAPRGRRDRGAGVAVARGGGASDRRRARDVPVRAGAVVVSRDAGVDPGVPAPAPDAGPADGRRTRLRTPATLWLRLPPGPAARRADDRRREVAAHRRSGHAGRPAWLARRHRRRGRGRGVVVADARGRAAGLRVGRASHQPRVGRTLGARLRDQVSRAGADAPRRRPRGRSEAPDARCARSRS